MERGASDLLLFLTLALCVFFFPKKYIYLLPFHSSVSFMSASLAPWFIPLPPSCRPIPPRCSLFLFVFAMVDDALPVTAPLHHFSHPLHEQDGEREKAEKGGLRRIMRPGREVHISAKARQKKEKKRNGCVTFWLNEHIILLLAEAIN